MKSDNDRFDLARAFLLLLAFWACEARAAATEAIDQQRRPAGAHEATAADPLDWPNWRGPEQNGISRETGLIDKWDYEGGSNTLWKNVELGGISTPIVLRGKLYTIVRSEPGTTREGEKVICVDAVTGKKLWESRFNVFLSDVPAERIGWSCCVGDPATGRIYAMGVNGYFQCLDGDTGQTIWSRSLNEEFGLLSTYGGRTNVPVLFDDMVIISAVIIGWGDMAKPAHRFMAFNKESGEVVWFSGTSLFPKDTTYSTPMLSVLGGQAAMVFGSGDGNVWALQPRTGKAIWNYQLSLKGLNVSPVVADGKVYTGHSEENADAPTTMGGVVALDGTRSGDTTKTGPVWKSPGMVGKSSPVLVDGRLYAFDEGAKLYVINAATGEHVARPTKLIGSIMHSSPVYADGKIYACSRSGWHVLKPTDKGVKFLDRVRLNPEDEVLGSPVVSHGRIYVPTMAALYCIGQKDHKPAATSRPEAPQERPAGGADKPAWAQVVPAELLLKPGDRQKFTVRLFNARGQLLKTAPAQFSLKGPGKIGADGEFVAPRGSQHAATIVTAKIGELTGRARVRIVPPLPWRFDVAGGTVPVTWVGARYRHVAIDYPLFEKLRQKDRCAGELYIHLTANFVNNESDTVKFSDRIPTRPWTVLLRYVSDPKTGGGLIDSVTTLDDARRELDPALEILKQQGVIDRWTWSMDEGADRKPQSKVAATAGRSGNAAVRPAIAAAASQGAPPGDGPQYIALVVHRRPPKTEGVNFVMAKITTIPLGTRSQSWMGPTDLHDYTIQADMCGAEHDGKLPDMGLIAQRYTLDLMGAGQRLQIRSWVPVPSRFSKTVDFKWNPNTWYALKFRAATDGGKAILKGKVWPCGQAEPADWTIEAVDDAPNLQGSPGLFGNATNAEVFIDDIAVTPN